MGDAGASGGARGGTGARQAGLGGPVAPPVPAGVTPGSPHAAPHAQGVVAPRLLHTASQAATTSRSLRMAPCSWGSHRPRCLQVSGTVTVPRGSHRHVAPQTQAVVTPRSPHMAPRAVTTPRSLHMASRAWAVVAPVSPHLAPQATSTPKPLHVPPWAGHRPEVPGVLRGDRDPTDRRPAPTPGKK